eukprot:6213852-Pleurochrysis_carterae.AAC.1
MATHRRNLSDPSSTALRAIRGRPETKLHFDSPWDDAGPIIHDEEGASLMAHDHAAPDAADWAFALRWSPPGKMATTLAGIQAATKRDCETEKPRRRTTGETWPRSLPTKGSEYRKGRHRSTSGDVTIIAAAARRWFPGKDKSDIQSPADGDEKAPP